MWVKKETPICGLFVIKWQYKKNTLESFACHCGAKWIEDVLIYGIANRVTKLKDGEGVKKIDKSSYIIYGRPLKNLEKTTTIMTNYNQIIFLFN